MKVNNEEQVHACRLLSQHVRLVEGSGVSQGMLTSASDTT